MVITDVRATIGPAAALFRGFADPTRLAIIIALSRGEMRVSDLVDEIGTSQPNISNHVACLKDRGLLEWRHEGRQVHYRLAHPQTFTLLEAAEQLLSAAGTDIALCPTYGNPPDDPR